MALANGDEHFFPPRPARDFAVDLCCVPVWYAQPGSIVLAPQFCQDWFRDLQSVFPSLESISVGSDPEAEVIDSVEPWGWDPAVRKQFLLIGTDRQLIPDNHQIGQIRNLSHRRTAIEALNWLRSNCGLAANLPEPAKELQEHEIELFANRYSSVVFKAPWSGSGRGLFRITSGFTKNARGWARRIIDRQGSIIAEKFYDKVLDFALSFSCVNGRASFTGYSLFTTDNQGKYIGNHLLNDSMVFDLLQKYVPGWLIDSVREELLRFLTDRVANLYTGHLGVDMMIYREGEQFCLHPCVEINLRMTMGLLAHRFFYNFVDRNCTGMLQVDYNAQSGALLEDHLNRNSTNPLRVVSGVISRGYLTLSPVTPLSKYRIRVEIK